MQKKNILFTGFVSLIVVAVSAYLLFSWFSKKNDTKENNPDSLTPGIGVGAFDAEGNPIDISTVPTTIDPKTLPPAPNMGGPITFPKGYPKENQLTVIEKIRNLQETVEKNPADVTSWIEIGLYWKLLENYTNAEAAWLYATKLTPGDYVTLGNLGVLYGYYIHDFAKAEEYFLKALEQGPEQTYLYFQTSDFYRDAYNNLSKAKNIVDRGILANPKDMELKELRTYLDTL
ncbi:MAG: hypothetical protein U1D31_01635 [Patescibacteria group bacterium]|nr:hypothetical protein [bacterium]MDZ4240809.1 hypothetical protein [Patescibacteria group bacterium]